MPDSEWAASVRTFLGSDYELDRLWDEHQKLKAQLAELDSIRWQTEEQQQERRRLQRLKLHGKDKITSIMQTLEAGATPV